MYTHTNIHTLMCVCVCVLLLVVSCSSGAEVIIKDQLNQGAEVITVDVQATKNLLNQGYRYVDVR